MVPILPRALGKPNDLAINRTVMVSNTLIVAQFLLAESSIAPTLDGMDAKEPARSTFRCPSIASNRPDGTMTENENTNEDERQVSSKRGSGVLIGRFLAVGLFVALGTFAVIQSLSINGEPEPEVDIVTPGPTTMAGTNDPVTIENPKVETPAVRAKSSFGSSIANTNPSMPVTPKVVPSSGTFAKTLKPVVPVVVTPRQTTGTFGKTTPVKLEPKPKPPLNRIAQLPNGSPRSTFGTGGPATTPTVSSTAQGLGNAASNLKNQVGNAASNVASGAASRFNQLGNGIKNTASDVGSRAKSAFGSATNAASRFGTTPKPAEPVVTGSPFSQSSSQLKTIEANPTLGSSTKPPSNRFQSRSLNPISSSSTQQTRTPNTPIVKRQDPPPRRPLTSSGGLTGPAKTTQRFSNAASSTRLPTTSGRAPMMQASRVSPKPGDRQYEGVQSPSMIIQKFSPKEIQVNQTADFEVKVRNVGRISVDDVLVMDQVPQGAKYIDANPKPTSQSRTGELQWQLGTMEPGEERTILLQLQPTEPGEIGSVAQFYFGGRATNRTKVTQPKLKITHTADPKVLIGNNVVFDVIVENTGNGPAKDVVIQEEVPELLEYQDGSRELEYEIGTLQPGQSRRLQLGLRAARVGRMQNVMFASAKGGLRAKHEAEVEIIAPKLRTTSEGPTKRYIQREVSHTFTVANDGTAPATNLRLIARLPSGLRYVDANNRGRYDRNSHSVIWQMRDLSAGGSGDVEVSTTPVEAGVQNIKFEAEADLNQRSETVQNLNVDHLIDVFFEIDDVVDPIEIGAETRYQIRLVNQGTQAASNVILQADFPPGIQPTAVDGDLRNQIRGQQIVFEPITSLRSGEEVKVVVQATGRTDGDHRVVVNMQCDGRSTPVSKQETTRVYPDQ